MMRAAVYCRVSTADQADHGYSLPSQLEACRQYAAAHGLEVVAELVEDCSGATAIHERPEGSRLMAMVERRDADAVVVHQVDRLSRDIVDLLSTVRDWLRLGVHVHAGDVGQIQSELDITLVLRGWMGAIERGKLIERSMRGKRAKARAGKVVGGPEPYGYRHVRDSGGKVETLKIHEGEAEVVRMIYRLYVEGDGPSGPLAAQAIAKRLSALKITTPGERRGHKRKRGPGIWHAGKVLRILSHEVYAGRWRYGVRIGRSTAERPPEEHIIVEVPAIVDRGTWDAAQKRKARNRRRARRNRRREYLLSGMISCVCGWAMSGYANDDDHRYYKCGQWRNRHAGIEKRECFARAVRADAIEPDVWESLVAIFADLDELEARLRQAQAEELTAMAPKRTELEKVEALIVESELRAADIARELVKHSGAVGRALEQEAAAENSRHEELVARREELKVEVSGQRITDDAIRNTVRFATDVQRGLEGATFVVKRRMLEFLDVRVTVDEGRFRVNSAIGTWSGEVRTLPKAWEKGGIVNHSCSR